MRVANAEMVRALRVMTVERGVDPRGFALLAFGGAGGLHARRSPSELGIDDGRSCPRARGVLSALGLAAADRRDDGSARVLLAGASSPTRRSRRGRATLRAERRSRRRGRACSLDLRYAGQAFELTGRRRGRAATLREAFHAAPRGALRLPRPRRRRRARHRARRRSPSPGPTSPLGAGGGRAGSRATRAVTFGGDAPRGARSCAASRPPAEIAGPAVVELPGGDVAVPPGWRGARRRRRARS